MHNLTPRHLVIMHTVIKNCPQPINKLNISIISYLTHCDVWIYHHYEDDQTDDDDFSNDGAIEFGNNDNDNNNNHNNNNNVINMEKGNLQK